MGYPEHEKLHRVKDETQRIGAFLEWLEMEGIELARRHKHVEGCYEREERGVAGERRWLCCDYQQDELEPVNESFQKLLARWAGIDLGKLEVEKRALLEEQRALSAGTTPAIK